MTRDDLHAWQTWLARVEVRCDVADVPVLIRRLGKALEALEPSLEREPRQLRLEAVS